MTGKIILQHNEREFTNFNDFNHVVHPIALHVASEIMRVRSEFLDAYMDPTQLIELIEDQHDPQVWNSYREYKVVFPTSRTAGYVVQLTIRMNPKTGQWSSGVVDISTSERRLGWCNYHISGFSVQFTFWRAHIQE